MIKFHRKQPKEPLMIDVLKMIFDDTNNDGVSFTPNETGYSLNSFTLKGKKRYIKYDLGNMYHIILYKQKGDEIFAVDKFESILTSPEHYIENIIKCGFFGLVVKKTEKNISTKFVNAIYKNLK